MKNIKYITFVSLFFISYAGSCLAGSNFNLSNNFLKPSPYSEARIQLIQNMEQQQADPANNSLNTQTGNQLEYKDRGKAFIRSLLIPGAGEKYLGKKTLAKTFFFTEVALWTGYIAFYKYGKWIRKDALAFAATHSGAITDDKHSQFFVDIGNYKDIDEYNDAKQRMRQFDKVYTEEDHYWKWDKDSNRHDFEQMRIAGDRALNRSVFVLGAIFANHLISSIDAVWQTRSHNRKLKETKVGFNVLFDNYSPDGRITFNIQKAF